MLERDERVETKTKKNEEKAKQTTKNAGKHDPLKNTRQAEPIQLCNRFEAFAEDPDADDENELEVNDCASTKALIGEPVKHKLNKRQRMRRKKLLAANTDNNEQQPDDHDDDNYNHNCNEQNFEQLLDSRHLCDGASGPVNDNQYYNCDAAHDCDHTKCKECCTNGHRKLPPWRHSTDYMRYIRSVSRTSRQRKLPKLAEDGGPSHHGMEGHGSQRAPKELTKSLKSTQQNDLGYVFVPHSACTSHFLEASKQASMWGTVAGMARRAVGYSHHYFYIVILSCCIKISLSYYLGIPELSWELPVIFIIWLIISNIGFPNNS